MIESHLLFLPQLVCIIVENEEDIAAFKDFVDDDSSTTAPPPPKVCLYTNTNIKNWNLLRLFERFFHFFLQPAETVSDQPPPPVATAASPTTPPPQPAIPQAPPPAMPPSPSGRVIASPLARKLAREKGIDLPVCELYLKVYFSVV